MTEPSLTTPAPVPDPASATPPAPAPKKKGRGGRVVLSILVALVLLVAAFVVRGLLTDTTRDMQVGSCIDTLPGSTTLTNIATPHVLDCSQPKAVAKIMQRFDGKTFDDAEKVCLLGQTNAAIELTNWYGGSVLLCLRRNYR